MRIGPPAVPTGSPRRCSRCGVALWRRRGPRGKGEGEGRLLLLCRADWSWPPGARNDGRARTRHRSSRGAAPATALYTRWAQTELLPRCCLGGREQAFEARHERVALGLALALRNASAARQERKRDGESIQQGTRERLEGLLPRDTVLFVPPCAVPGASRELGCDAASEASRPPNPPPSLPRRNQHQRITPMLAAAIEARTPQHSRTRLQVECAAGHDERKGHFLCGFAEAGRRTARVSERAQPDVPQRHTTVRCATQPPRPPKTTENPATDLVGDVHASAEDLGARHGLAAGERLRVDVGRAAHLSREGERPRARAPQRPDHHPRPRPPTDHTRAQPGGPRDRGRRIACHPTERSGHPPW